MSSHYPNGIAVASGYEPLYTAHEARFEMRPEDWNIIISEEVRAATCFMRIFNIQTEFNLCEGTGIICMGDLDVPLEQVPLNGHPNNFVGQPEFDPKFFHGYLKFAVARKMAEEDLACAQGSILGTAKLMAQAKKIQEKILLTVNTRAYNFLLSQIQPCNTGGYIYGGTSTLGSPEKGFELTHCNSDCFLRAIKNAIVTDMTCGQQFQCIDGANLASGEMWALFPLWAQAEIQDNPIYRDYSRTGVAGLNYMGNYDFKPQGIETMFDACVEPIVSYDSAGKPVEIYPVLFGKRDNSLNLRWLVTNKTWEENMTDSVLDKTNLYLQMMALSTNNIGVAYITRPADRGCEPCTTTC